MQLTKKAQQRRKLFVMMTLFVLALFVAGPAFAQVQKVNDTMNLVVNLLKSVGIAVATVSLLWGGYKMQYQGATFAELAPKFGGMILAGAASTIAGYMMA